jgi:hypothetical protein
MISVIAWLYFWEEAMEIGTSTSTIPPGSVLAGANGGGAQEASQPIPLPGSNKNGGSSENLPDGKIGRPDFKEAATEMIQKIKTLGDFKDRKGLDEIKDMKIGPDIRYAIKAADLEYLRRVIWGPLTIAEFREVKHRISELEREMAKASQDIVMKVHDEEKLPGLKPGAAVEVAA